MKSKKNTAVSIVTISVVAIIMLIMTTSIISLRGEAEEAKATHSGLLKANESLVQKVVDMEEKNKQKFNEIKDYIIQINNRVPPVVAKEIVKNIIIASDKYNLPIATVIAVIERESHFNPYELSNKGARGLMQVMPVHLKELNLKSRFEYHGIGKGINAGAFVLRKYLDKNGNDMEKALLEYVHYDPQYVLDVYNSMGKFIVFKELADNKLPKEVVLQLHKEEIIKPEVQTHTIIEGDTLSLIAQKYTGNVLNWKKLQELNKAIDPVRMQIGTTIVLPNRI